MRRAQQARCTHGTGPVSQTRCPRHPPPLAARWLPLLGPPPCPPGRSDSEVRPPAAKATAPGWSAAHRLRPHRTTETRRQQGPRGTLSPEGLCRPPRVVPPPRTTGRDPTVAGSPQKWSTWVCSRIRDASSTGGRRLAAACSLPLGPAVACLAVWLALNASLLAPLCCFADLKRKEQGTNSQAFS